MMRLGNEVPQAEATIIRMTREILQQKHFAPVTAVDIKGKTDYLNKIVDLIRGCGFGIAIYSDQTPARTMGNIFFEVGICGLLGKSVQLVYTGEHATPSDFVRTEWIKYRPGREADLRRELESSFERIEELAEFYKKIGDIALGGEEADLELAFERYKQAVLISNHAQARQSISEISLRLKGVRKRRSVADDLSSHRVRLLKSVEEFLALLPAIR
jgi:hypothetical protein